MKGYFSRIAKQSGLRFSESGREKPDMGKKHAYRLPEPPGIEETVLIPPALQTGTASGSPGQEPEGKSQVPEQPTTKVRAQQKQALTIRDSISARRTEKADIEYGLEKLRMDSYAPGEHKKTERSSSDEKELTESKTADKIRPVEQNAFEHTGVQEIRVHADPVKAEKTKEQNVEIESLINADRKSYFTKTAELIERGGLDAGKIRNIVFHEVREWVAASPAGANSQDKNFGETTGNMIKPETMRAAPEPEVITVRDAGRMERTESAENPVLEEQSFNLSIGTISIIEDSGESMQQVEVKRQDQGNHNTRQESARRFSRLRRNYL